MNPAWWLILGLYPIGAINFYEIPTTYEYSMSGYTEFGIEVQAGPLYGGGSIRTNWHRETGDGALGLTLTPHEGVWEVEGGIELAGWRLGALWMCRHPILPNGVWWEQQGHPLQPQWESTHLEVYLKLGGNEP